MSCDIEPGKVISYTVYKRTFCHLNKRIYTTYPEALDFLKKSKLDNTLIGKIVEHRVRGSRIIATYTVKDDIKEVR